MIDNNMAEEKDENKLSPEPTGTKVVSEAVLEEEEEKSSKPSIVAKSVPSRQGIAFRPKFGAPFRSATLESGEFESRLLDLARVVRVSAGGKRLRFRAVVVIGNKMGKVGVGVGKGLDVAQAVEKATRMAKKNILNIPTVEGTIPYPVMAKFGAAQILLKPQRKGKGLVAGGTVRIVCSLAGIKDISSKMLGRTSNKLNNAMATIAALKKLKIEIPEKHATEPIKTGT